MKTPPNTTVVVKDFLGHATVATTENYYINTKPALRAAANARKVRLEGDEGQKEEKNDEQKPEAPRRKGSEKAPVKTGME